LPINKQTSLDKEQALVATGNFSRLCLTLIKTGLLELPSFSRPYSISDAI
jgi:hypothetical protein